MAACLAAGCYNWGSTAPTGPVILRIIVRLFASYRERVGKSEVELELPEGSTVGYLAARIAERYPGITRRPDSLVVAVNQEYRDHLHGLDDGDEVALIPPVSGGVDD